MKYTVKKHLIKALSLIMVLIFLLCSLSACGNSSSNPKDEIEPLSLERETEIRELIYNEYKSSYPKLTADNMKLNYLGEFDGSYAVIFETGVEVVLPDFYEIIGGFEFAYLDTQPIHIINGDDIYRLEEAHNNGIINDDDLSVLFKRYRPACTATLDDEFNTRKIIVWVMPSSNFKAYTPEDFAEINCIEVRDLLTNVEFKEDELGRILLLTVKSYSKGKILKCIKKLEQRDDIYQAHPGYEMSLP